MPADILRDMPSSRRLHRAVLPLLAAAVLAAPALTTAPDVVSGLVAQPALSIDGGVDLPFNPQLASVSCPVERGPVKEGADADRLKVSTTVSGTTVAYLRARSKPSSYPKANRIAPNELHTWQLNATLTQYKQESDGDVHLILKDGNGRAMIAEIPYPACVPTSSRWKAQITSARSTFTQIYGVSTSLHYAHRSVTVRGLGLFDPPHGQTGAAPNGIELHPVTGIAFH